MDYTDDRTQATVVLGWQSSRSRTSRQAKGGRVAAQSDPLCPTSRGQLSFSRGTLHLTPLNPGSWPGTQSPWRMNPHTTHCSVGWCLQYAPALQYIMQAMGRLRGRCSQDVVRWLVSWVVHFMTTMHYMYWVSNVTMIILRFFMVINGGGNQSAWILYHHFFLVKNHVFF